jgi:hypothetical protein
MLNYSIIEAKITLENSIITKISVLIEDDDKHQKAYTLTTQMTPGHGKLNLVADTPLEILKQVAAYGFRTDVTEFN